MLHTPSPSLSASRVRLLSWRPNWSCWMRAAWRWTSCQMLAITLTDPPLSRTTSLSADVQDRAGRLPVPRAAVAPPPPPPLLPLSPGSTQHPHTRSPSPQQRDIDRSSPLAVSRHEGGFVIKCARFDTLQSLRKWKKEIECIKECEN